jgi:hypothetical protein
MPERFFPEPDAALREGLRRQDVPEVAPGFDDRVLAAVRQPGGWLTCWPGLRHALAAGALSMVAMLGLIRWSLTSPATMPAPKSAWAPAAAIDLDRVLDHPETPRLGLYAWRPSPHPQPSVKPVGGRSSLPSPIA